MTRDAAAQAVHERLEHAVSAMPSFDVDAGWTALAAQLEGPIAPVIPLRRRRPHRMTALAVAAAVFIGGSALAMVRHAAAPGQAIVSVTLPGAGLVTGPHVHGAFSGAPPTEGPASRPDGPSQSGGGGSSVGPSSGGGSAGGGSSSTGSGGSGTPNQDSPDDIDHGSGNDGQHNDNGHGNNTQWHQGQGSNDQGSNGQGSNGQ